MQSSIEKADESESESKKRVLKLTEGREFNEAGVSVFEDIDWNKRRAATIRQGMNRVTVCFVNVKNSGCLTRIPCLISSSNLQ
jgi:hypothetical protein